MAAHRGPASWVMPLNLGTSDDEQIRYVNIRRHVVDYPGLSRCNTGYGRERYCKQHREARRTLFHATRVSLTCMGEFTQEIGEKYLAAF